MATVLGNPVGQTTTTNQNVSGYARPVVDTLIQRSMDLANKPYQGYTGPRVAGLSDLQQQALGGIAGLQAYKPGQYTTGSWTDQGTQQQFMSPYQQGVTDIAKREAQRTADINATQTGAQAVNQGAFGGYRHGVVEAENARNTQQLLNDIQTKGLQSAYASGMQQFNAEQQQRLQQQQAQEAANQYGYQSGISALGTQLNAGSLPQQIQQRNYDVGYENYLAEMSDPYKKTQFLQQSLQGLPITNTTQALTYDKPNPLSQAMGLAGVAKGLGVFDGIGSLIGGGGNTPGTSNVVGNSIGNYQAPLPSVGGTGYGGYSGSGGMDALPTPTEFPSFTWG